jgi:hypothetical protein
MFQYVTPPRVLSRICMLQRALLEAAELYQAFEKSALLSRKEPQLLVRRELDEFQDQNRNARPNPSNEVLLSSLLGMHFRAEDEGFYAYHIRRSGLLVSSRLLRFEP